jgi:zinc protease
MLAALMNNGSYGLPQYLIEQEKWVSSVEAEHYPMRDYGSFYVFFRADPEKERAVTDFVSSFLFDFDVRQIPADVFEETRRELLFGEARDRESVADRAGRLGFLVSRRDKQGARELVGHYESLSAEDVQAAKERWFGARRLVTAVVLPEDFDEASVDDRPVQPGAPYAPAAPDLRVAGALERADTDPLSYTKTDEADGVHAYTYANGLRVLVRPTDASVLLGVTGRVLGGQWVEDPGQEGINRFVSELGMRTTRRWNRESFARLLGSYSIDASAHARVGSRANTSRNVDHRDSAAHHYLGLADQWEQMLAILKETLFFPSYDAEEIEKVRSDLVTEIRSLEENNLGLIKQEFYVAAYAGHPCGRPTLGTEEAVSGITAADLEVFHRTRWTPARTVVTIVGDVDPDEIAKWIASRWGDLGPAEAEPWAIDPSDWPLPWSPPRELQTLDLGKDYWTVNWGRPGVTYDDPEYFPSVVLSRIAGNDHFYKYVYGEGVSYRSWIRFWENLGPGAWIVENDVKRERFEEILAMFDDDLVRYSTEGFPREEFDSAVQRLVNSSILGRQDYDDVQALSAAVFGPGEILRVVQQ